MGIKKLKDAAWRAPDPVGQAHARRRDVWAGSRPAVRRLLS